ncbi:MAG: DUF2191 domain-containing protein [Deltaproteobacteria bacterium]|nr:DUF2191 domain-containing protein [Deltaproteobacteria bacterium]
MVTHMKTTVEIPEPLLNEAKAVAAREGTTLRAILEEALREALKRRRKKKRFKMRDASVPGKGLAEGISEGSWEQIRDLAYKGRGG